MTDETASEPSPTRRGDELELVPTAIVAGGDALARDADGRVVFVAGALPGERVRVALETERKGYSTARLLEVLEPAAARVVPPCPELARGCGACQWQHIEAGVQRSLKRDIVVDAFRRIGKLDVTVMRPTVELPPWHYRTTVRAVVAGGRAGFRRARSHAPIAVDSCLVAHPLLLPLITDARYPGADEVILRCGSRTGELLAAPIPGDGEVEFSGEVRRDFIHEEAAGQRWRISADSFFQTRADGVDELANLVGVAADELGAATTALDLYSGVGLFAGVLAARGWTVTAVESSSSAAEDARANLGSFDAAVVEADVGKWTPAPVDLVVADPSRSGLGRDGVGAVKRSRARRLVLVSCDAASLARDVNLLSGAGYGLTSLTPVDLFPHTFHVEVVSVFDR